MAVKRFSNSLISQSGQDKVTNFIAGYSPAVDEMDLIERVIVGSGGAANVTFSNIPQTYQHLQIRCIGRTTFTDAFNTRYGGTALRINGDSGNNYARHGLDGDGASTYAIGVASTGFITVGYLPSAQASASVFGVMVIDLLDYASTSKTKTVRSLTGIDDNGAGYLRIGSGLWNSTSAITSVRLEDAAAANFAQHSTASIYGVKA